MASPLFEIYDPQGQLGGDEYDPITNTWKKRRPTLDQLLPPAEKASMLSSLANMGASGLSAIGWMLDTPGAVVRGTLSGGPIKGLSALIETSDDRVTGRELLRQYGLAGNEDGWGNFSTGLAAEILLDPTSYVSLGLPAILGHGARSAAGRAAARAGMLSGDLGLLAERAAAAGMPNEGIATMLRSNTPASLASLYGDEAAEVAVRGIDDPAVRALKGDAARAARIDELQKAFKNTGAGDELWEKPLARMNRLRVPYVVDDASDFLGQNIGDMAAQFSDRMRSTLRANPYTGPVVRTASALFDPRTYGFTDEAGQRFGRGLFQAEQDGVTRADTGLNNILVDVSRDLGGDVFRSPEFAEAFGDVMENQAFRLSEPMAELFKTPAVQRLVAYAEDVKRQAIQDAERLGIPLNEVTLPNDIGYFPRQSVEVSNPRAAEGFEVRRSVPLRGKAIAQVGDGGQAGRRDYTQAFPRWVLNAMFRDDRLQGALRGAGDTDVRQILDEWLGANAKDFAPIKAGRGAYDYMADGLKADDFSEEAIAKAAKVAQKQEQAYIALADSLRRAPLQMAEQGIPRFGNSLNDFVGYVRNRARNNSAADVLLGELAKPANVLAQNAGLVPGGAVYSPLEALAELGFKTAGDKVPSGVRALAERMGIPPDELLNNRAYGQEFINRLSTKITQARAPKEAGPLLAAYDWYTQAFKQLALLWPARYSRDAYSGAFAGATKGAFSPLDWLAGLRAGGGNYAPLARRLEGAPGYSAEDLFPGATPSAEQLAEARVRKFLKGGGGQALTQASVADDLGRQARNLTYRETFPGAAGGIFSGLLDRMKKNPIPWDLYRNRTSEGNTNWLLDLGDRMARATDSGNRIGSYLTRIRRGDSPEYAKAIADLTQVNYSPEAFTSFERDFLKRIFPFYSYTKGITPLVADELLNNPAGLMGQSIRLVNRGSEPSPDRHIPEYLRQSAAIPVESGMPLIDQLFGVTTPGVTRFLTNIDLPHESVLNLLSPGVSNTLPGIVGNAIAKTGSNVLGQTNPLLKGPLEYVLNRQFYSGRQLSDLYSVLEQQLGPTGRGLEQVAVNLPGGSRVIGTIRQAIDQRISPRERAAKFLFNALTGLKFQDVDQDKTFRLAARTTLNDLLDQAPGMSSYENLFIKPEELAKLSPQEQRQYLLYRVLQSEAAKNARARKKQPDALAPFGL